MPLTAGKTDSVDKLTDALVERATVIADGILASSLRRMKSTLKKKRLIFATSGY